MTPNPMPAPMPQPPQSGGGGKTGTIIAIVAVVLFGCCGVGGILAAIAIPNFIKFQSRSKQAECKMNLKSMYTAQKSYFAEKDDYAENFADIGFAPEPRRRYTYFMGEGAELAADMPEAASVSADALPALAGGDPPGVFEQCPGDCFFVGVCAGNLDNDATLDVWSISSVDRTRGGETIPAGVPFHDVDDVLD